MPRSLHAPVLALSLSLTVDEPSRTADSTVESVCTFLALMLSGFAPVIHMLLVEGSSGVRHFPLLHTAIMALFYLVGTVVYLTHWPEKKWAGTFDIWVGGPCFLVRVM